MFEADDRARPNATLRAMENLVLLGSEAERLMRVLPNSVLSNVRRVLELVKENPSDPQVQRIGKDIFVREVEPAKSGEPRSAGLDEHLAVTLEELAPDASAPWAYRSTVEGREDWTSEPLFVIYKVRKNRHEIDVQSILTDSGVEDLREYVENERL